MMKQILVFAVVLLLVSAAFSATAKDVTYKSGDETVKGILYTPEGKGPFPALVVIHEWWGLNDWVKDQASKLADQGYVTLAVDLYRGKVATTPEQAHEIMRGVPDDRATRDLLAASSYLRSLKQVDSTRVGSIGWCMGGGYSLDLAIHDPKLAATVINYGHLATEDATLKQINAPILGIFGALDQGISPDAVHKFEQQMKGLNKSVEVVIFPDAGHAFENPNNKSGYRAEDAAKAWADTVNFLSQKLKKGAS
jgi:carboxymethylenebutenolidase